MRGSLLLALAWRLMVGKASKDFYGRKKNGKGVGGKWYLQVIQFSNENKKF
jgi:hypothetical protein